MESVTFILYNLNMCEHARSSGIFFRSDQDRNGDTVQKRISVGTPP